jgi:(E)-4-hydroxy-3-methylbut-2-enyl-diphosphate synthase
VRIGEAERMGSPSHRIRSSARCEGNAYATELRRPWWIGSPARLRRPPRERVGKVAKTYNQALGTMIPRRKTRTIRVRDLPVGGEAPIAVQSMAATSTRDLEATGRQIRILEAAGADLIRIAVDSRADVEALTKLREGTSARLSVDLQESYRLAADVAPHVDKIRYNPGHLHHHEKQQTVEHKVAFIADAAKKHGCAIRIGINAGSIAPEYKERYGEDSIAAIVACAVDHCAILDRLGFQDYLVSIKDSDPRLVVDANVRFAGERPDVPIHLGVTEAGMPPEGIIKTRIAFEQCLSRGIGDTIRVSLTVPFDDKGKEIEVGREILRDIENGRFRSVPPNFFDGLNIIACPSCSRVENAKFIELAEEVKRMSAYAKEHDLTIAVMGCRVNGPGETDDADLGLWCGPKTVNLKRGSAELGAFGYDEILPRLRRELDLMISSGS